MEQRDYQTQAIKEVYDHFKNGIKSCLIFGGTGSGKTAIASFLIRDAVRKGRRVLFLVHRKKLVKQTQNTLARLGIECGLIKPGEKHDYSKPVQIAMAQTLEARWDKQGVPKDIGLVIFDEAHILSYFGVARRIIDEYGIDERGNPILVLSKCFFVGLTATPFRQSDKEGFCQFYQAVVSTPTVRKLQERGALAHERVIKHDCLDLNKLETDSVGEFSIGSLVRECGSEYNQHVIDKWKDLCKDMKTVSVCVSVKQAKDLNQKFLDLGIKSEVVMGSTPDKVRDEMFKRFSTGETQVINSVGTLCLDNETEILTSSGWVGMNDMTYSHKVANWDNGTIFFKEPKNIVIRDLRENEKMIAFKSTRMNIRVTEDHKMVYQHPNSGRVNKAEAINFVGKPIRIPVCGLADPFKITIKQEVHNDKKRIVSANAYNLRKINGYSYDESFLEAEKRADRRRSLKYKNPEDLTNEECTLIGFWLADGHVEENKPKGGKEWTICSTAKNTGVVDQVEGLMESCGIKYKKRISHPKHCVNPFVVWSLKRGTIEDGGIYSIEPYLNKKDQSWLWGLNEEQFDAFINGFWMGDGDHGDFGLQRDDYTHHITNIDKKMLDSVQCVAVCRGYYCAVKHRVKRNIFVLCFKKTKLSAVGGKNGIIPYIDSTQQGEKVWCVTTDSGNILTRRKGCVAVTGNCEGFDEPSVECCIVARPTRSLALFLQIVGRAIRKYGDKVATILDFGGCFDYFDGRKYKGRKLESIFEIDYVRLCPMPPKPIASMTKECPNCLEEIHQMAKICPECGYEIPVEVKDLKKPEAIEFPEMCLHLDGKQRKHYRFIREQIKTCYDKKRDPMKAFDAFYKKFEYMPNKEWLLGSIFGLENPKENAQIYVDHLIRTLTKKEDGVLKFWLELEFGTPGKTYVLPSGEKYTSPELDLKRFNWWEYLDIDPFAPVSLIKSAYQTKLKENAVISSLNYALDTGLKVRGNKY